ncbi:hypothetical protein B0T16DRAFT_396107 [Cercophora newfieldiana]|uniref:Uncharacterized protein n=1 Tax=Cercophora newfieldiana TaxID=92897 RepID=A0AA39YPW1_9PEZI|nr:hypothetical protein B0T16DRAFT_396107 [Cercophora newfieldiana]
MPIALHSISIQMYLSAFSTLQHLLAKAQSSPTSDTLPQARLAPDMIPLSKQITKASNIAKAATYQVLGPDSRHGPAPVWADEESTLEDLIARCDKTIALLKSITPEDLEGKEDENVETVLGNGKVVRSDGKGITLGMGVPNVMFHVGIAYAILRAEGVPIGKGDYLGGFVGALNVEVPEGGVKY